MIAETTINLYPIIQGIKFACLLILLGVFAFLIHNGFVFKAFSKHDMGLFDKFLSKYPNVAPEFMKKGLREQNIENNQEIHEINKKLLEIEKTMKKIVDVMEKMQNG